MASPSTRVCLDANIWVHYVDALTQGRATVTTRLVDFVVAMAVGVHPIQLFLSLELIGTIERTLLRLQYSQAAVHGLLSNIAKIMQAGPDHLRPPLLVSGRDQLAMRDREDAGVLASCFAARVGLLATDNLRDFQTNDSERIDTKALQYREGLTRQLYALIHTRADGVCVVVMHPVDVVDWFSAGKLPTPDEIRFRYKANGRSVSPARER